MSVDVERAGRLHRVAHLRPRAGVLQVVTAGCLVVLAGSVVGLIVDPRQITGDPAWLKPVKFAVSIAVYCGTLAWLLTLVRGRRRLVRAAAWATGGALALEMGLIVLQVVRGMSSHYNVATPFDAAVFQAMGSLLPVIYGGGMLAAALLVLQRGLPPVLASGIRGGLVVSLIGMAVAVLMLGNTGFTDADTLGAHTVGAADGGPGLPVTGWSTEHGDLRVAHFVGLHALQALPLLAWLLQHWGTRLGLLARVRLVRLATAASVAVVALLTWQAERGLPLLHPDTAVLSATALLAGVLALAVTVVAARDRRAP